MSSNHYVPAAEAPGVEYESHAEKMAAMFGGTLSRGNAGTGFVAPKPSSQKVAPEPAMNAASATVQASAASASPNEIRTQPEIIKGDAPHDSRLKKKQASDELDDIMGLTRGRTISVKSMFETDKIENLSIRRRSLVSEDSETSQAAAAASLLKEELDREAEKMAEAQQSRLTQRSKTFSASNRHVTTPASTQSIAMEAPDSTTSKMLNRRSTGAGLGNLCVVCEKPAYAMEKMEADGLRYHTWCFRCCHCNKAVKAGNYAALNGKIYCKPCFMTLFKKNGNYANGFGHEQHKMKWIKGTS